MGVECREVKFAGSVQGVGFRWKTAGIARSRMIRGWVRNDADGGVTLLAQGDPADVDGLLSDLEDCFGPYIREAAARNVACPEMLEGFRIIH